MFYTRIALAVGALVVAAFLYSTGYRAGSNAVEKVYLAATVETQNAFAYLAHLYAKADARAAKLEAEANSLVGRVEREVIREIVELPPRECGFTVDERRVLNKAHCDLFPASPACGLPGLLPRVGDSASDDAGERSSFEMGSERTD